MLTGLAQEAFDTLDPSYLRELEKSRRKLDIDKASELLADWPDLPMHRSVRKRIKLLQLPTNGGPSKKRDSSIPRGERTRGWQPGSHTSLR